MRLGGISSFWKLATFEESDAPLFNKLLTFPLEPTRKSIDENWGFKFPTLGSLDLSFKFVIAASAFERRRFSHSYFFC